MLSLNLQKGIDSSKSYSNRSFKTNQESTFICSNCKASQEDLKSQVAQLKEKAHQSFMQVLQIQQLHEEEITQMREQWDQKEKSLCELVESQQEQLRIIKSEMEQLQKNVKKHTFDCQIKELVIDNIESIGCMDDERSYLDQSALMQFKELLTNKNPHDYVASLRRQIYKDFKFISNNKTQVEKLFLVIKELKDQNSQLSKINQMHKERVARAENQIKQMKTTLQNSQRQNKFISQNLKRLGNDKLKLEKKVSQLQKGRFSQLQKGRLSEDISISQVLKSRRGSREDSADKIFDLLKSSDFSMSRRQINELNYAKFMGPEEVQPELITSAPLTPLNMRKSPQKHMFH